MLQGAMVRRSDSAAGPGAHPPDAPAGVLETHISIVVLLGAHVYKLRKPVRFDFADFSSASARLEDCRREVELNRRLAPDVYLGVADIALEGEVLEHAVVMRRLDARRSLARLVRATAIPSEELDAVARRLASFHAGAARGPEIDALASPAALHAAFDANVRETERFVGTLLPGPLHARVVALTERFLESRADLLEQRIAHGAVCDGHGDLQAADVFCLEDGPRILDCLEFDDRLRYGDVAADVAFLAMDLQRLGSPDAARLLIERYEAHAQVELPRALVDFYVATRAYVRAKVACLRYEQGEEASGALARALLELALDALERSESRLVVVGGLPGSGKSTLARALGEALGMTVIRSDVVRLELVGRDAAAFGTGFGRGAFRPEVTERVYAELFERARRALERGEAVVLDASFVDAEQRVRARALGAQTGSRCAELHCSVGEAVAAQRLEWRAARGEDPSRATLATRRSMARLEDPWPEAIEVDTSSSPAEALAAAIGVLGGRERSGPG